MALFISPATVIEHSVVSKLTRTEWILTNDASGVATCPKCKKMNLSNTESEADAKGNKDDE